MRTETMRHWLWFAVVLWVCAWMMIAGCADSGSTASEGCIVNSDCATGQTCLKGICVIEDVTRCESDDDCADDERCVVGFCKPTTSLTDGDSDPDLDDPVVLVDGDDVLPDGDEEEANEEEEEEELELQEGRHLLVEPTELKFLPNLPAVRRSLRYECRMSARNWCPSAWFA